MKRWNRKAIGCPEHLNGTSSLMLTPSCVHSAHKLACRSGWLVPRHPSLWLTCSLRSLAKCFTFCCLLFVGALPPHPRSCRRLLLWVRFAHIGLRPLLPDGRSNPSGCTGASPLLLPVGKARWRSLMDDRSLRSLGSLTAAVPTAQPFGRSSGVNCCAATRGGFTPLMSHAGKI